MLSNYHLDKMIKQEMTPEQLLNWLNKTISPERFYRDFNPLGTEFTQNYDLGKIIKIKHPGTSEWCEHIYFFEKFNCYMRIVQRFNSYHRIVFYEEDKFELVEPVEIKTVYYKSVP